MIQHSYLLRTIVAGLGLALLGLSGCSAWMKDGKSFGWFRDEKPAMPTKVVGMWTDTVLTQPGMPARRGFGGRIMFYPENSKEPVKVEGTLVIYAFDEEGRTPENVKPDRKFVFTAEQFRDHYSKANLGHSYSVWLPWDDVGGPQKEISLIIRFEPKNGPVVIGEQSRHVLPGPTKEMLTKKQEPQSVSGGTQSARGAASQVRTVSHQEPVAAATMPAEAMKTDEETAGRKLQTTTIRMPMRTPRPFEALGVHGAPQTMAPANPAAAAVSPGAAPAQAFPSQTLPGQPYAQAALPASTSAPRSLTPAAPAAQTTAPTSGWPAPPPRTPQARSAPSRPRALGGPVARLERDHVPSRQFPSALSIHPTPEQLVPESMRAAPVSQ